MNDNWITIKLMLLLHFVTLIVLISLNPTFLFTKSIFKRFPFIRTILCYIGLITASLVAFMVIYKSYFDTTP